MTRFLYGAAWALLTPLVILRLAWRSRRQHGYLERLGERFGSYDPVPDVPRIWIHAVSVGETRAAAPLVEALTRRYPGHRILITHMTPTGRATGEELFGDRVERAWLPYDLGFAVRRFLAHYRPRFGVVLETELWPRLLEECARANVPVMLANARLSQRSARRYARVPRLTRWALSNLAGIAAQGSADAQRFQELGATATTVTGNVKFDLEVPEEMIRLGAHLRVRFGVDRPVWVAGSTREGEEALILEALASAPADVLMVIVPRHPQRFADVALLASQKGFETVRRSDDAPVPSNVRVVVGDSMGEMLAYYEAADVVVMGGSLLPYGGQNLIEPCALARPVIVGPHTYNFEEVSESAIAAGAAVRVDNAAAALQVAAEITGDLTRRKAMGEKARSFVATHRGAVARLTAWIEATISARGRG